MTQTGLIQWTVASGLLTGAFVIVMCTSALWAALYMNRVATRQWKDVDPAESERSAALKAVLYKTARGKFMVYFIVVMYLIAFGLLIASGIAKLVGA